MTDRQQLESIIELAEVLSRQTDFQEILRLVTQRAKALFGAESAYILMVNPTTKETIKTVYKQGDPEGEGKYQLLHTYLTGWVLENNRGFFTADIGNDKRFRTELFEGLPVKALLCAPFRGDGIIFGTLLILSPSRNVTGKGDLLLILEKYATVASPFLRNFQKLQSFFEKPIPEPTLIRKYEAFGLFGRSDPFISMLRAVDAATRSNVRVMLEGESGTGKELVAKAIHYGSARAGHPFIAIDCGAIPRELIESELFGHVKGAFTGAAESRKGLLEEANRGTLFMDEISNLPIEMQSRLLRVLQENEIRPVGSNTTRKIDVRIIAASSQSLRKLLEMGTFREDLFFRLYVYPIEIPSLRQRINDIPLLTSYFLNKLAVKQGKKVEALSQETLEYLMNHSWKGNIRELENLIERMVTLVPPGMKILESSMLPDEFRQGRTGISKKEVPGINLPLQESLALYEKRTIEQALEACHWNQSAAARMLQVSEHTIRYKMKKLGIVKK